MVQLLSRAQVGLRPADAAHLSHRSDPVVGITWHITDTPPADPLGWWRGIQADYMDHKGYGDIPYNGGIATDGRVLAGRDAQYVGAHALAPQNIANRMTWGIAIIDHGELTAQAEAAMRTVAGLFQLTYHRPPVHLFHSTWNMPGGSATDCPGDTVRAFVRRVFSPHA